MVAMAPGTWMIRDLIVNSSPVLDQPGFQHLVVESERLRIEPVGLEFQISQATGRSAILESRSQIFFADFSVRNGQAHLKLSRPAFSETVEINAVYDPAAIAV